MGNSFPKRQKSVAKRQKGRNKLWQNGGTRARCTKGHQGLAWHVQFTLASKPKPCCGYQYAQERNHLPLNLHICMAHSCYLSVGVTPPCPALQLYLQAECRVLSVRSVLGVDCCNSQFRRELLLNLLKAIPGLAGKRGRSLRIASGDWVIGIGQWVCVRAWSAGLDGFSHRLDRVRSPLTRRLRGSLRPNACWSCD
jgi:hypothetical protein